MIEFLRSRVNSFLCAFEGWWFVIRTQKNAWIHATISLIVIIVGYWLRLSNRDWAVIILAIAMVWAAEFFNTALEAIVDLASPEMNQLAKIGKDVGAAAVLIAAFASVIIGLLIMGPPFWERLSFLLIGV